MPKANLAPRSYPLAILMALVLFVCSWLIATSSVGTMGGGGDDQGSGMGGTGRTGGYTGDSGFGGTGGPSPFLGSNEAHEDAENAPDVDNQSADDISTDSLIEPFLQQQDIETARIPEDMRPLIELQRSAPQNPELQDSAPALNILDDTREELPPHARRLLDMAEAGNTTIVEPALEIRVQIPDTTDTDSIEPFRMEVAEPAEAVLPESGTAAGADDDASENSDDAPFVLERLNTGDIADNNADNAIDETQLEAETPDGDRPLIPERIQRPELPPFQRMRPAVDRAAITAPRPRPMQI